MASDNIVGIGGLGALDPEDSGFVLDLQKVLCGLQGNKKPRAFAVFDDAAHVELVVQQGNRLPDFDVVRLGIQVVHEQVVRVL